MGLVTTTGEWTGVSVSDLTGLAIRQDDRANKSEIRWGTPAEGSQSGYDFEGYATDAVLDGTDFALGKFTHHNYPIVLNHEQFWVYLAVSVYFQDNDFEHRFKLRFRHEETPNVPGYQNDPVKLPDVHENDRVYVDGVEYEVTMTGFLVEHGQRKIKMPNFDTPEKGHASAKIFAQFKQTSSPSS
ncbi:choice-of-anchor K domain-containing protein [Streptomyces sp. 6N223]|uniref:choice-of-anchor K domain-containing protein n=1 Tax=Streptomyces sp. 6N223 TaxID=3457412 RepID=UPI003FD41DD8